MQVVRTAFFQVLGQQGQSEPGFADNVQAQIAFFGLHAINTDDQPTPFGQLGLQRGDFGRLGRPQQGQEVRQEREDLAFGHRQVEIVG